MGAVAVWGVGDVVGTLSDAEAALFDFCLLLVLLISLLLFVFAFEEWKEFESLSATSSSLSEGAGEKEGVTFDSV